MLKSIIDWFIEDVGKKDSYLYHAPHVITLVLVFVACGVVFFAFRNKSPKAKRIFLWVLFGLFLTLEVLIRVRNLIKGKDLAVTLVPMHFCAVIIWFIMFAIIVNKKSIYSLAAMGGLLASSAFLFYPAVGFNLETINFNAFYSIFSHCLTFVASFFLLTGGFVKYRFNKIWHGLLFAFVVLGYSALLNFVFYPGENYLYYVDNPFPFDLGAWFQVLYGLVVLIYLLTFYVVGHLKHKYNQQKMQVKAQSIKT